MTLTSEPPKDLSAMRTENSESHLKEPSPTGGAEPSVGHDVAEEGVIRPLSGSYFSLFLITLLNLIVCQATLNKNLIA